jgi:AcrR family transcriptional regulator
MGAEVARRAGVGHGTLYRNFPDRSYLAASIMADEVDRLERHADDPDAFFVLLRRMTEAMARSSALMDLARRDTAVGSALEGTRRRIREIMKRPLRKAKAAGTVRRDLTLDDVFLILMMLRGALFLADDPAGRAAAITRALSLALDGAAPSGGHAGP